MGRPRHGRVPHRSWRGAAPAQARTLGKRYVGHLHGQWDETCTMDVGRTRPISVSYRCKSCGEAHCSVPPIRPEAARLRIRVRLAPPLAAGTIPLTLAGFARRPRASGPEVSSRVSASSGYRSPCISATCDKDDGDGTEQPSAPGSWISCRRDCQWRLERSSGFGREYSFGSVQRPRAGLDRTSGAGSGPGPSLTRTRA